MSNVLNPSFEDADASDPGLADQWFLLTSATEEEGAEFALNPSDAYSRPWESFDRGWTNPDDQQFLFGYQGITIDLDPVQFDAPSPAQASEDFENGWVVSDPTRQAKLWPPPAQQPATQKVADPPGFEHMDMNSDPALTAEDFEVDWPSGPSSSFGFGAGDLDSAVFGLLGIETFESGWGQLTPVQYWSDLEVAGEQEVGTFGDGGAIGDLLAARSVREGFGDTEAAGVSFFDPLAIVLVDVGTNVITPLVVGTLGAPGAVDVLDFVNDDGEPPAPLRTEQGYFFVVQGDSVSFTVHEQLFTSAIDLTSAGLGNTKVRLNFAKYWMRGMATL